jgi:hypothetical protein
MHVFTFGRVNLGPVHVFRDWRGSDHWKDLGKILKKIYYNICKRIKFDGYGMDLFGFEKRPVLGFYKNGYELSDSMKGGELLT